MSDHGISNVFAGCTDINNELYIALQDPGLRLAMRHVGYFEGS
jgi:hypothetical protein